MFNREIGMKILLTGGTGFIGSELVKSWNTDDVTLLTRSPEKAKQNLNHLNQNNLHYIQSLDGLSDLNDFDVVVNLAGEPIADKRWSAEQKERICNSRWHITEKLVELIHASSNPPKAFISGSAVGYYGNQSHQLIDESFSPIDKGFTHSVCSTWESIAQKAKSDNTRVCILRTGVVLGKDGGVLPMMLLPFKFALGSSLGDGKQYMPWIHLEDLCNIYVLALTDKQFSGAINAVAPMHISHKDFTLTIASILNKKIFLPNTPAFLIKLIFGNRSNLILNGSRISSNKIIELGYTFKFPKLEGALKNIFQKALN